MAWNEPGGKNNDPWGGGNQGPPDLDEALKKLQERLNKIFGGGGGSSSGGGPAFGAGAAGAILVLVAIVWALFGFYQVDEQERAVVLRFGVYHATVAPGLHWNPPLIDSVEKVNITKVRSIKHRSTMLTEDENIVDVSLSAQYTIRDPANYVLRVREPERSLEEALKSSLRHVVGGAEMDKVITEGRAEIAVAVHQRLQSYVDTYQTGIHVAKINIEDAQPPSAVQDAFDDVTRAKEDKERLKNEAQSYANAIIPEARGNAQRQMEEAKAYRDRVIARAEGEADRFEKLLTEYRKAPEVTRKRLYLDTLQTVYGNVSKVMVDVEGGNNLMYLPLDKLMDSSRSATGSDGGRNMDIRELTDRVVEQLRRDSQQRRGNEGGR